MDKNIKPYLIGIAGGSASGKTLFLKKIREQFGVDEVCIISQDNYYRPAQNQKVDENGVINFDLPEGVDEARFLKDIDTLTQNNTVQYEEYTFNQPGVKGKMIVLEPAPVIMVEGLFLFHFTGVKNRLDLKVFMDAREDLKLARRIARDVAERGLDEDTVLYQWYNHAIPSFNEHLLRYRDEADIIITNNVSFDKGFEVMRNHVIRVLSHGS